MQTLKSPAIEFADKNDGTTFTILIVENEGGQIPFTTLALKNVSITGVTISVSLLVPEIVVQFVKFVFDCHSMFPLYPDNTKLTESWAQIMLLEAERFPPTD